MSCEEIGTLLGSAQGAHLLASLAYLSIITYYLFKTLPILRPPLTLIIIIFFFWALMMLKCELMSIFIDLWVLLSSLAALFYFSG
jgi:hypothetical protein